MKKQKYYKTAIVTIITLTARGSTLDVRIWRLMSIPALKELTKTLMMIRNWRKSFGLMVMIMVMVIIMIKFVFIVLHM